MFENPCKTAKFCRLLLRGLATYVCLYVCESARIAQKHVPTSRNFLYMLPVAVAQSFSDDNAMYYVLPVLCMASRFSIMGQIQIYAVGELFTISCQMAPRAKSAILEVPCLCAAISLVSGNALIARPLRSLTCVQRLSLTGCRTRHVHSHMTVDITGTCAIRFIVIADAARTTELVSAYVPSLMLKIFISYFQRPTLRSRTAPKVTRAQRDRGHNRHGPKRGGCCAPFTENWDPVFVAWVEVYFRTKWRLHPAVWPQ